MRFKLKPEPSLFEQRIIKKFAWFPIEIDREIRWLEKVAIKQRYLVYNYTRYWENLCFVDEREKGDQK